MDVYIYIYIYIYILYYMSFDLGSLWWESVVALFNLLLYLPGRTEQGHEMC